MKSIRKRFRDGKLKHKLMGIYICIGTIPMLLLGIFTYYQQRNTFIEKERQNVTDALSQGVSRINSQMLVYNNLSDYVAFNSPISNVLKGEYNSTYEMYEQYTNNVDPVLSSLKYFNPNIKQLKIYVDRDIVRHDTSVAPLSDIADQKWYQRRKLTQKVQWVVDMDVNQAFSVRTMPIMEQDGQLGVLYVEVDYDDLFAGFEKLSESDYGLCVFDENDEAVYESSHFNDENESYELTSKELLKEYKRYQKGKGSEYTIASKAMNTGGWRVIMYRPESLITNAVKNMIFLVVGIIAICLLTSMVAAIAFSSLVVRDIVKLQKNMESVEGGDMTIRVTSDAKDEVGNLIRGFGSMIAKINHLIHEVYEGKLTQRKYEMRALQAQINPHFLYNSLSLINWKALEAGKEDISKLTLALSSFYRTSLNRGNNVLTIEKEIENMKSYLEIQSCMHDDSFDVIMDIDESILQYETLNLLLQPLVENAIEHGVDLLEDRKGYIKIIGRKEGDTIHLIVEDNGIGIEREALDSILEFKTRGYGVRNVNARIQLFYGEEYKLQIESEVGKGTRSMITIPQRMPDR